MIFSVKRGDGVYLRYKFKSFVKYYEGDFGEVSMKTLETELGLWEEHWSQKKNVSP